MLNDFSSCLMLSCHNEKHLKKIPSLKTKCIMLNLEDGVSSEQKPLALSLCAKYLNEYKNLDKMFIVRVNALDDGGLEEIEFLNKFNPDAIRVPKIRDKKDVELALKAIKDNIELHLSVETSEAWKNLATLKLNERVSTFYLGILDLFADMKLPHSIISRDNPTIHYILSHFLITCLSVGVKPVSFVYQEYNNLEEFNEWLLLEKKLGYSAKGCISPKQCELTDALFVSADDELNRARRIVELFEFQKNNGITGFSDGELGFIDEPIYKGALALLQKND